MFDLEIFPCNQWIQNTIENPLFKYFERLYWQQRSAHKPIHNPNEFRIRVFEVVK